MASVHLFATLMLGLFAYAAYQISEIEVNPENFTIQHRLEVDARSDRFFRFLVQEDSLEKLLPWLTRLKEADRNFLAVGKNYRAFLKLPILGTGKIQLTIVEYRPPRLLVLDSNDKTTNQRIELRVKQHKNRSILQTTVRHGKTSAVYHYTFGLVLRRYIQQHLKKSSLVVAEIYRAVTKPLVMPERH